MSHDTAAPKAWALGPSFAHLLDDGGILQIPVDEAFWSAGIQSLPAGRLISQVESSQDWPVWERHPHGDEWIYQISGIMTLILETPEGEKRIRLDPGSFTIVPKGLWHTADIQEPGKALFITPGEGTEHRERS